MSAFQKATKKKAKLRLALFGASGSGKTYTALRIAKGLSEGSSFNSTGWNTGRKTARETGISHNGVGSGTKQKQLRG